MPKYFNRRGRGKNSLANKPMTKREAYWASGRGAFNPAPQLRPRNNAQTGGMSVRRGGPSIVGSMTAPVAASSMIRRMPSSIDNMAFSHSELVTTIYGSTDYNVSNLSFQPGLPIVFPWLSQLASLWDMYNVISCTFTYVPTCSTATPGSILIGFDYDVYDDDPIDKSAFMQLQDACTAPSWSACDLPLKSQSLIRRKNLFVRSGTASGDAKSYDLGKFIYATQGQSNDNPIGDIYISYSIRMAVPQQVPEPIMGWVFLNSTQLDSPDATTPWGISVLPGYDYGKVSPGYPEYDSVTISNNYVFGRSGIYYVSALYTGTGISVTTLGITIGNTADFPDDTIQTVTAINNAAGTNCVCTRVAKITERNWLKFVASTVTTMTEVYVLIIPVENFTTY